MNDDDEQHHHHDEDIEQPLVMSAHADWTFTILSAGPLLLLGAACGTLVAHGYLNVSHARIFLLGLCGGCMAASFGASPLRDGLRGLGIIAAFEVLVICAGTLVQSYLG